MYLRSFNGEDNPGNPKQNQGYVVTKVKAKED